MKRLVIQNIGPIKDADIELKRFNVIIGSQSSGKSTIAKVLSTCCWVEKETATMMNESIIPDAATFIALMVEFHKMTDYFDETSEILYDTDVVRIVLKGKKEFSLQLKNQKVYQREKICYIPSERNSVTLPELQGFEFGQTNLRSFLFDWYNARELYLEDNKADILNLGVRYYYDPSEAKFKDRIEHVNGKTYKIPLGSASSGLQSVVPLQVMMQYYSGVYFDLFDVKTSFDLEEKTRKIRSQLTSTIVLRQMFGDNFTPEKRNELIKEANSRLHKGDPEALRLMDEFRKEVSRLTVPVRTSFIVEEPEQNLYPFTQLALTEAIVNLCSTERKHGCTITTHSPFILNYLNVMIARYYKGITGKAILDPNTLGVFVTGDGRLNDLMQKNENTGEMSVNAEDLVEAMRYMYTEYRELKEQ